jgi:hypothetical protein
VLLVSRATAFGDAAPGWSRGQQELAITWEDCVKRAGAGLRAEGYRVDQASPFVVGIKGVHTAVIMCNPGPANKMWANIVVASNGEGGGTERQRLQTRMEGATPPSVATPQSPTSPTGTLNVTSVGGWTAVWTRRGNTNTWDGIWKNGSRTETTVMEGGFQGNQATFKRTSSSDGNLCEYTGTIAADGRTVSGTQKCAGISDYPWQGTFAAGGGSPTTATTPATSGTAMSGTNIKVSITDWTGNFSSRGSSNVWDGVWTRGSQRETTVMEGGFQGKQLYLKRTYSSDGHLCEYRGTVSADGGTVSGTQSCPGLSDYAFTATITSWMR